MENIGTGHIMEDMADMEAMVDMADMADMADMDLIIDHLIMVAMEVTVATVATVATDHITLHITAATTAMAKNRKSDQDPKNPINLFRIGDTTIKTINVFRGVGHIMEYTSK